MNHSPADPAAPTSPSSRYARWRALAFTLLTVALLALLAWQVDWQQLAAVWRAADPLRLAAAVGCLMLATIGRVFRFDSLVPVERRYRTLYAVLAMQRLFNQLPLRTGEFAMAALLERYRLVPSVAHFASAWLVIRVTDVIALVVCCLVLFTQAAWAGEYLRYAIIALALLIGGTLLLIVAARRLRPREDAVATGLVGREWRRFCAGFAAAGGVRPVCLATLWSIGVWIAILSGTSLVIGGLHAPLDVSHCLAVAALGLFVAALPIHGPLGLGTADSTWTAVLMLAGLELQNAIAIAFGLRCVAIGAAFAEAGLGGLLLPRERSSAVDRRAARSLPIEAESMRG